MMYSNQTPINLKVFHAGGRGVGGGGGAGPLSMVGWGCAAGSPKPLHLPDYAHL